MKLSDQIMWKAPKVETGKVEYGPDYESEKSYPDMTPVLDAMAVCAERQRLEREVADTAKRHRQSEHAVGHYWDNAADRKCDASVVFGQAKVALDAFNAAVDALLEFESQHGPRQ